MQSLSFVENSFESSRSDHSSHHSILVARMTSLIKMMMTKTSLLKLVMTKKAMAPLKQLAKKKRDNPRKFQQQNYFIVPYIYVEMMFVTLKSFGQDNIDLTAFDREYRRAFDKLPAKYQSLLMPSDRPPNAVTVLCRKFFRELKI